VAALPLAAREHLIEAANRTLELAKSERDVWGFRDAAEVRATRLDDEPGARAALEGCAALFSEPVVDMLGNLKFARGSDWVLVGQGFVETLRDEEGMRACLEAGRNMARAQNDADDLCDIAVNWARCVDREAGVALLLEAETMAVNGSAQPWTLANAWSALGVPEAMRRVLDSALDRATSVGAALHVARAWGCRALAADLRRSTVDAINAIHAQELEVQERDGVKRAVTQAREFATTARDWLQIAESTFDLRLGESLLRDALERARALATDNDERGRVSTAYRLRLHDEDTAARIGPRGVRPEAVRPRVRTLVGWETSASGLFDWLRDQATMDVFVDIANSDGFGASKHAAALQDICETGLVPRRLEWHPHEALALTRWSSGETTHHLERALCCTLLCICLGNMEELVTNGPILAESCLILGPQVSDLAERFFAWRSETEESAEHADSDDVGQEQPIALLLILLLRASSTPDDPRLGALADMLLRHPRYPLSTLAESMDESMKAELWTDLIHRILVPLAATRPPIAAVLSALGH